MNFCSSCGFGPIIDWEVCTQCGCADLRRFDDLKSGLIYRRQYEHLREKALKDPKSYQGKVIMKMAFDRNPMLALFADKLKVRSYVAERVGQDCLPKIFQVAASPFDIDWTSLPREYVIKVNHGSGGIIKIHNGADPSIRLPHDVLPDSWARFSIHPDNFDLTSILTITQRWLSQNFEIRPNALPEWAYGWIDRRVYIEELLREETGQLPWECKIHTFNGKTSFLRTRAFDADATHFYAETDPEWKQLTTQFALVNTYIPFPEPIPAPANLGSIIEFADKLAEGTDSLRVDIYNIDGKIFFGELTNYPWAGGGRWMPEQFNYDLGQDWTPNYPAVIANIFCINCGQGPGANWELCPFCGSDQIKPFDRIEEGFERRESFRLLRGQACSKKISTFSQKVKRKLAFDRRQILTLFADKYRVREYVAEKVGRQYLTKVYAVADDPQEIYWKTLPREFVCKVNHGSGGIIIVYEGADLSNKLPESVALNDWSRFYIHPDSLDIGRLILIVRQWLSQNYCWRPDHSPEWAYQSVSPLVFCEEFISGEHTGLPIDYKFFTINGVVRLIRNFYAGEGEFKKVIDYDRNWKPFSTTYNDGDVFESLSPLPKYSPQIPTMITLSEKLSAEIDFIRADFYLSKEKIFFGELTNYPNSGVGAWSPEEFNFTLGEYWKQCY